MIEELQQFILTCPLIELVPFGIDFTNPRPESYGVSQTGNGSIKLYIDGSTKNVDNFAFYFRGFSSTDFNRLQNNQFTERMREWFDIQNAKKNFPIVENVRFTSMRATNSILFDVTSLNDSIYQIQIQLNYLKTRRDLL